MRILRRIEETKKPVKICALAVLLIICLVLAHPADLHCKDAGLSDMLVTSNADHITVYAKATRCFTKKMESAILAGVPTTFTYLVELYQERKNWFDKQVARITVKQTIKYDNVKKTFYVFSTGMQSQADFQDFESAKKAMSELNGAIVAPVKVLNKLNPYYIRMKVKLDTVRLPMHMEYILFFVSLWDFETDWYRQNLFMNHGE